MNIEYIISKNGKQYLKLGIEQKISFTTNITLANRFTYNKASQFLKNCISPKDKNKYKILAIDDNNYTEENQVDIFKDYNYDWISKCTDFQMMLSNLDVYRDKIQKDYEYVEAEYCDIRHKIEFPKSNGSNYNAVEGYKLFKLQSEILRKRRKIKNEKRKIGIIKAANLEDFKNGSVIKQIQNIDNQKYTPRVLIELFEDKVVS